MHGLPPLPARPLHDVRTLHAGEHRTQRLRRVCARAGRAGTPGHTPAAGQSLLRRGHPDRAAGLCTQGDQSSRHSAGRYRRGDRRGRHGPGIHPIRPHVGGSEDRRLRFLGLAIGEGTETGGGPYHQSQSGRWKRATARAERRPGGRLGHRDPA